jgi:hypothetical protein
VYSNFVVGYKNRFAKITLLFNPSFACEWILWLLSLSIYLALRFFPEQSPSGHFAPGQRKLL